MRSRSSWATAASIPGPRSRRSLRRPAPRSTSSSARPASRPRTNAASRVCQASASRPRPAQVPDPSYGQNVLQHSVETSFLAVDDRIRDRRRRSWPAQDGRTAARHRQGRRPRGRGSPRRAGAAIAQKYDELPFKVVNGIACAPPGGRARRLEAPIVQVADANARHGRARAARRWRPTSSASRTSRRSPRASAARESFAVLAGREVRILVRPKIDDLSATRLARDIVKRIRRAADLPGPDQGHRLRYSRAVESRRASGGSRAAGPVRRLRSPDLSEAFSFAWSTRTM